MGEEESDLLASLLAPFKFTHFLAWLLGGVSP